MLALVAASLLAQTRADTFGRSNAQILAMGRKDWFVFYSKRHGGTTAAMVAATGLYGDALAARNDRLGARRDPLRTHLRAFADDAQAVGAALSGGGTIWTVTAAELYADMEEALYRVLTHSGHGPRRLASDVTRVVEVLQAHTMRIESPKDRATARRLMAALDADLRRAILDARRWPRRDSDTILEFLRATAVEIVLLDGRPPEVGESPPDRREA